MFSVTTSEIRWFMKGEIPVSIKNWFDNLKGFYENQSERTDIYLQSKNPNVPGIKFREGRFEVKQKIENLGVLENASEISGNAELWKKWSFESKESEIQQGLENEEWIKVAKARSLQKYIFDQNGKISGGFDNYKSDGCNLELTKVFIHSSNALEKNWWTLGLETYGSTEFLYTNLQKAFEHIFVAGFPISLQNQHSFSYPEWLSILT